MLSALERNKGGFALDDLGAARHIGLALERGDIDDIPAGLQIDADFLAGTNGAVLASVHEDRDAEAGAGRILEGDDEFAARSLVFVGITTG